MRTAAIILAALGLAGCGQVTWTNANLTDQQAAKQFYECKQSGRQLLAHGSQNLLMAIDATTECLTVHGFSRSVR